MAIQFNLDYRKKIVFLVDFLFLSPDNLDDMIHIS